MRDILHIFRKDVRRLIAPIILILALQVTFVFSAWRRCLIDPFPNNQADGFWILKLFLPVAWMFLIAAVVFQEQVPGTKQYWLTRPISWPKVFAAKVLFVLLFVNFTWFLSDCAILLSVHLPIQVADLLLRQIPLSVLLFLPSFGLACVTNGVGQFALGLLFALLGFIVETILPSIVITAVNGAGVGFSILTFPVEGRWLFLISPVFMLFFIAFQYARRSILKARIIFVIPLFVLVPLTLAVTASGGFPGARTPEISGKAPPLKISLDIGLIRHAVQSAILFTGFQIPIKITDLPVGTWVEGAGQAKFSKDLQDQVASIYHDRTGYWLQFRLTQNDLPKVLRGKTTVKVQLAMRTFRIVGTRTIELRQSITFSPAVNVRCRNDIPFVAPFACWSGPRPEHQTFRGFVLLDQVPIEMNNTEGPLDDTLNWGISPVNTWLLQTFISGPALRPKQYPPGTKAEFVTLDFIAGLNQTIEISDIDLSQYLVRQ